MNHTAAQTKPALEDRADDFMDWTRRHARQLAIGAVTIGAVAAGGLLYRSNERAKEQRAERAYEAALQPLFTGNSQMAQSDLEKLRQRYSGTDAADRGGLLLVQVLYDQGKFDDGIKVLNGLRGKTNEQYRAAVEQLTAMGYEQLNKPREAAQHFQRAAEHAQFDVERLLHKANAARALAQAGDKEGARKIWAELAADPESPTAGEARVRLGELSAQTAGKS